MIRKFKVTKVDCQYFTSTVFYRVLAIETDETERTHFLLVNDKNGFKWVYMGDCKLAELED